MTMALKLLCRVVRNRVAHGEDLEAVLNTYAKLTKDERKLVADGTDCARHGYKTIKANSV